MAASSSPLTVVAWADGVPAARTFLDDADGKLVIVATVTDACDAIAGSSHALLSGGYKLDADGVVELVNRARDSSTGIGFLDGWRGETAARHHARQAATWRPRGATGVLIWDDMADAAAPALPDFTWLTAGSSDVDDLFAHECQVLGVVSHGNGLEVILADDYLCALVSSGNAAAQRSRFLPCAHEGVPCIRAVAAPDGKLAVPGRHDVSRLPGEMLVLGSCYGALVGGSAYGPEASLRAPLLERDRAPALIAPLGAWGADSGVVAAATVAASRGQEFGEVVHDLNAADRENPMTMPGTWILFGDPRAAFPANGRPVLDDPTSLGEPGVRLAELAAPEQPHGSTIVRVEGSRGGPKRWLAPVGGRRVLSLCGPDSVPPPDVAVMRRDDDDDLRCLVQMWTSVGDLQFTDTFFRVADQSAHLRGFVYPPETAHELAELAVEFTRSYLHFRPENLRLVYTEDLTRLLGKHRARWQSFHVALHDLVKVFVDSGGGVLDHGYGEFMTRRSVVVSSDPCAYCGTATTAAEWSSPFTGHHRTVVSCAQCTNVSDVPSRLGRVDLLGPSVVEAGSSQTWRLEFSTWPGDVAAGVVSLGLQRHGLLGGPAGPARPVDTASVTLQWDVPADLPDGAYFLLGLAVVDGSLIVARRPLLVRAREAVDAPSDLFPAGMGWDTSRQTPGT